MPELWVILVAAVIALTALALGGVIGYLLSNSKAAKAAGQAETLRQDIAEREAKIGELHADVEAMRGDLHTAEKHGERTAAQLEAKEQALLEQRELLASAEAKLKDTFAGVGREALKANTEAFLDLAKQRFETQTKQADGDLAKRQTEIEKMLAPMKVLLGEYQKRLAEIEESRTKSYSDIRQQLGQVAESHRSLGEQTTQLVSALRNPGTRGQWGELKLKRLLELAGMTEHFDFNMQVSVAGEGDGVQQRPDLVVDLPGERRIVVDSKYSADDFLKAADEDNLDRRVQHLRNFAKAVRRHGQQLSQKKYWEAFDQAPNYVVMFMPGEALLYAAVEHDPALVEELMQKGVILATPTTLLALLKTVAMG
ncbi:MAG: DNA recombination protein RmuC, partial [Planctomycetota bacterium]